MRLAALGFQVSGVDFSETAIEMARRNAVAAGLSIDFTVGDCLTLSQFAAREFDVVVDNHVLHCVIGRADRESFLQTACRVLKVGGVFFSETMSAEGPIDMQAFSIDPLTRIDAQGTRYWVTARELQGELRSAGFEILHQELRRQPDHPPPGDSIVTVASRGRA
jgi:2-polyprenyl-3-methyl-5-hydroxy-6-metoxy-1,4-benzoquinol methylase